MKNQHPDSARPEDDPHGSAQARAQRPEKDASTQAPADASAGTPPKPKNNPQGPAKRPVSNGSATKKKKKKKKLPPWSHRQRSDHGLPVSYERIKLTTETIKIQGVLIEISESEATILHALCRHARHRQPHQSRYVLTQTLLEEFPFRDDVAFIFRVIHRLRKRLLSEGFFAPLVITRRASGYRINVPAKNIKMLGFGDDAATCNDTG